MSSPARWMLRLVPGVIGIVGFFTARAGGASPPHQKRRPAVAHSQPIVSGARNIREETNSETVPLLARPGFVTQRYSALLRPGQQCRGGNANRSAPVRSSGTSTEIWKETSSTLRGRHAPGTRLHVEKSLKRSIDWLFTQQAKDGGWHSKTYGSMRGGASITALVLYTLSRNPNSIPESRRKDVERSLAFLRRGIRKKGFVVPPDGSLDYPCYATAMTLIAARRLKLKLPKIERDRLIAFLLKEQLTEAKGFKANHPDYGGWDLLAGSGTTEVTTGTNVSISAYVLEALRAEKGPAVVQARKLAAKWISRCQNLPKDGGFYFHPKRSHLGNKALWTDKDGKSPRSYGTATCDGLHILRSVGISLKDPRFQAGLGWLKRHTAVNVVPGFEQAPKSLGWKEGLRYYYASRLAPLLPLLKAKDAANRRTKLVTVLLKAQRTDGSWKSESARMREDDPLIATCLAIIALQEIRKQQTKKTK